MSDRGVEGERGAGYGAFGRDGLRVGSKRVVWSGGGKRKCVEDVSW